MIDCDAIRPLSTAWADGELPESERVQVDTHLGRCPVCRARLTAERSARSMIRRCQDSLVMGPQAPSSLRARCEQTAQKQRDVARRRSRTVLAIAAAATLVVSGYSLRVLTDRSTTVLAAQLATDHTKCHMLIDGAESMDSGVVQRRLMAEYGFDVAVAPSSPAQKFRLLGARRCLTGEGTNAHILYELDGRPVSVYLLPRHTRPAREVEVLGQHAYVWSRHNGTYVLIADKDVPELPKIARYVQRATEQDMKTR
jgi:anti-sigma factor RsiW